MRSSRSLFAMIVVATLTACAGKDGAAGPTGPQGPQGPAGPQGLPGAAATANRFVVTSPASTTLGVVVQLPSDVGTDPLKPPALACYMSNSPNTGAWISVNDGFSTSSAYCGLVYNSPIQRWSAVMVQMPSLAWTAAFVVNY